MQQTTSYTQNDDNARKVGTSIVINEKGAYEGKFLRAEAVVSTKGTQGIEFDFVTKDGQTAKFLSVWTVNASGEELGGRKVIDAIMKCIGIKTMNLVDAQVTKWDAETRSEVKVRAKVFPELMNKPVGMVLAREEYAAGNGEAKWKNAIVCPFQYRTNLIAGEIIDGKPAEGLDKILRVLRDRPMKTGASGYPRSAQQRPQATGAAAGGGSGFDDMDDDIPF